MLASKKILGEDFMTENSVKKNAETLKVDSSNNINDLNLSLAMDGTTYGEFSHVDNTKYSQEIISAARAAYNPDKLEALKEGANLDAFLAESRKQALAQWFADQALAVHSDMFRVLCQIYAGEILNLVEARLRKKSEYTAWLKENFENRHIRYFQQAKQLADMGNFAKEYAAAGKNRLLTIDSLRKVEKKRECIALFENYPLPDMSEDEEGHLLKKQIDSVITLHRLRNAEIRFATFEQAANIASTLNDALTVQKAEEIQKWLNQQEESQQAELFEQYIQDLMTFPSDKPYVPAPKESLNKILADLLNNYGTGKLDNQEWVETQRKIVDVDTLINARQLLADLIEKLKSDASVVEVLPENN